MHRRENDWQTFFTILSNSETGKMALLMESMKPDLIRASLKALRINILANVKQICSNMSPMYKKVCVDLFPNAALSVDKFHVIKQVLDVLQSLRIEAKNELRVGKTIS